MIEEMVDLIGSSRVVENFGDDPSVVGVVMMIFGEINGQPSLLVTTEKKSDSIKQSGEISTAGTETAKNVAGKVEGLLPNMLGALGEEVVANLRTDENLGVKYVYWGDMIFVPGVVGRLVTVSFDGGYNDSQLGVYDQESSMPEWIEIDKLGKLDNWRNGMADVPKIAQRVYDLHARKVDGRTSSADKLIFSGEVLSQYRGVRSTYPDTKKEKIILSEKRQYEVAIAD